MQYVHVKNLEKYHPGYKDRSLVWCKLHFRTLSTDPEFAPLHETDKWRFFAFVMLELQNKQPVPITENFLQMNGFDLKSRPISLTIQMLHNFLDTVTDSKTLMLHNFQPSVLRVDKIREEKSRVEPVTKKTSKIIPPKIEWLIDYFKDPEVAAAFFDHHEARGWIAGKTKMRDWEAAGRTWLRNAKQWGLKPPHIKEKAIKQAIQKCFVCDKTVNSDIFMQHLDEHKKEQNNDNRQIVSELVAKIGEKHG